MLDDKVYMLRQHLEKKEARTACLGHAMGFFQIHNVQILLACEIAPREWKLRSGEIWGYFKMKSPLQNIVRLFHSCLVLETRQAGNAIL